jgi:mono/diheme cytochrome c family protein
MLSARNIPVIAVALASGAWSTALAAQQAATAPLPDGVTPARIDAGAKLYQGPGMCFVCHGPDAKGTVGPNLTDTVWIHSKGAFPEIVQQILTGVPASRSKTGVIMPPRGGSQLSADQVEAVAAYVWSLSHPRSN